MSRGPGETLTGGQQFTARRENGHRRPKGYASWRPQRKTRALLEAVDEVLSEYAEHLPLTVRQVFYRLVATIDYPKTEASYNRLSEVLVRARRARLVPFEHLRDDGVAMAAGSWFESPADFWDDAGRRAKSYQRDRQQGQPVYVELWCESSGMLPQLARIAQPYSVPARSASGFLGLSAIRGIVTRACDRTVPTVLLHVGDLDPSGQSIFDSIAEDVSAFVEADRWSPIISVTAQRVAVTTEQIADLRLPTAPPKKTDSRTAAWTGETCQAEALPPTQLAGIVDAAIVAQRNLDRLAAEIAHEQADRVELLRALPSGADR